jgi:hypothetical protein
MQDVEIPNRNQQILALAEYVDVSDIAEHFALHERTIERIIREGQPKQSTLPDGLMTPEQKLEAQLETARQHRLARQTPPPIKTVYGTNYCRYKVKYSYGCGDFVSRVVA